jgi:hypothetical protein
MISIYNKEANQQGAFSDNQYAKVHHFSLTALRIDSISMPWSGACYSLCFPED